MEHSHRSLIVLCLLLAPGCQDRSAATGVWADLVHEAPGADPSRAFGDPALAVNGAQGAGCCAGGRDVYAISPALGRRHLVLEFSEPVFDGEGPDLVVFENPFDIAGGGRFMDPAVVLVSPDGIDFMAFPVEYLAPDPAAYSDDAADWVGFAGITPVFLNRDEAPADPFDPESGGDTFDLVALDPGPLLDRILIEGVTHVKVVPASTEIDPQTGEPYPADPIADGPDIDAIYGGFP